MFRHLGIATKMVLTFLVVICITALVGIVAIVQNGRLSSMAGKIVGSDIPSIHSATALNSFVGSHRRAEMLMIIAPKMEDKEKYIKRNDEILEKLKKEQAAYEKLIDADE